MDDDDIKATTVANQSDENKKPGAVHMRRNNRNDPNNVPTSATTEGTNSIDPSNNRLIRKLRGELPSASDIDSSRHAVGTGGPFTEILSVSTNAATGKHRMDLSNGHDNGSATGSHANRDGNVTNTRTTEVARSAPVDLLVNDDHSNPLIRKLRGELPNGHFNGSQTTDSLATSATMPVTTDAIGVGNNPIFAKLRGESPNDRYHQSIPAPGGLSDDLENGDIAIALAADEVDETMMPTAVEYDSDAKPSNKSTNRRIGLYVFLALSTLIIGIVGAFVGTKLTSTVQDSNVSLSGSSSAYRKRVAQLVSEEDLDDVSNPYHKALDWISNKDPMLTTPDSRRLIQRFILAYFYFATSARQPWGSDCAPSNDYENDSCTYKYRSYSDDDGLTSNQAFKWLSNTDECKWAGLKCDLKSQIREIHTGSGMEMFGTFPRGIVYLPYLQTLSLRACGLEGSLPDLREAKNLLRIEFWGNDFTGTIPGEWFQSRVLQDINVFDNQITGTISTDYSQIPDLLYLSLAENLLTGTIPTEIADAGNLQSIYLQRNSLQGGIPKSLGQMKHLFSFDASYTSINGTIPEQINGISSLEDFFVSGNLLTGKIPETFWILTNLLYVELADNSLSGIVSGKIAALTHLRRLNIRNNQFVGSLPARLGQTEIKTLVASGNLFNGTVAPQLCDLVENGQLSVLELDCATASNSGDESSAEVTCPTDCCTVCCTPDGQNCHSNF